LALRAKLEHTSELPSISKEDTAQRGITTKKGKAISGQGTDAEVMEYLWPKE